MCAHFIPSQCDPKQQFTCWSGDCIPIDKRCDKKTDCADESDEHFCTYITLDGNNYRKELAPKNSREKSKMSVFIGFDVLEIVEINEPRVREQYWLEQIIYLILFLLTNSTSDVLLPQV